MNMSRSIQRMLGITFQPRKNAGEISHRVRELVFIINRCRCRICEEDDLDALTIDHITPRVLGGDESLRNLQVLCRPCNSSKGGRI